MTTLHAPASACNAVAASAVRPDPDTKPADEFITGAFTDEKFAEFLDACPGRWRGYENDDDADQAETRANAARLFALRTSTMPADLLATVKLADALQAAAEAVVNQYAPMEARRVLAAFGVAIPAADDFCQSWGGDTFTAARRECRRLCRHLDEFRRVVWDTITHLVPVAERPEAEKPATRNGGAK